MLQRATWNDVQPGDRNRRSTNPPALTYKIREKSQRTQLLLGEALTSIELRRSSRRARIGSMSALAGGASMSVLYVWTGTHQARKHLANEVGGCQDIPLRTTYSVSSSRRKATALRAIQQQRSCIKPQALDTGWVYLSEIASWSHGIPQRDSGFLGRAWMVQTCVCGPMEESILAREKEILRTRRSWVKEYLG